MAIKDETEQQRRSPLVSILIPLFNKEEYVGEALQSALQQTYDNVEVIVIDDGSTDNSLAIVRGFRDHRLHVVSRENRGANATRNELLAAARGEFVQFLDADNSIYPTKISCQVARFGPQIDVVLCHLARTDATYEFVSADNLFTRLATSGVDTIVPLHRRATLESIGGWDPQLPSCQEFDLHLRLAAAGLWDNPVVVPEILACYRVVADSVSADKLKVFRTKVQVSKRILDDTVDVDARKALSTGIANAIRNVTKFALPREATHLLKDPALDLEAARRAYPRRIRWIPSLRLLVLADLLDFYVKRVLGVPKRRP